MADTAPPLTPLVRAFERTTFSRRMRSALEEGGTIRVRTLRGSLKSLSVASLHVGSPRRLLIVCAPEAVSAWYQDLASMLP
ncbi:MAG: hypothetical protein ACKOAX_11615, partial [Candidatus Kapaibacterium sp.]